MLRSNKRDNFFETVLKLAFNKPKQYTWSRSSAFVDNFEYISSSNCSSIFGGKFEHFLPVGRQQSLL